MTTLIIIQLILAVLLVVLVLLQGSDNEGLGLGGGGGMGGMKYGVSSPIGGWSGPEGGFRQKATTRVFFIYPVRHEIIVLKLINNKCNLHFLTCLLKYEF